MKKQNKKVLIISDDFIDLWDDDFKAIIDNGIYYGSEEVIWEGDDSESIDRVKTIKHKIDEYDKNWELVEIGAPTDENIPLMFRKK